jgi:hypothetical protein
MDFEELKKYFAKKKVVATFLTQKRSKMLGAGGANRCSHIRQ